MLITDLPSPNFDSREGQAIDMLVLHYTGMKSPEEAKARLCDAAAKVSAHYVVEEDGKVYRLVAEDQRAWHAGVSSWRGHSNINQRSIGIEIVNPGHEFGYRAFPYEQMEAVTLLCKDIVSRHAIPARNVVAHSDVAPTRKEDPGELFDWKMLSGLGVGLWPTDQVDTFPFFGRPLPDMFSFFWPWGGRRAGAIRRESLAATDPLPSEEQLKNQLATYGYETTDLPKTITAFQRHFFPTRLTGIWDHECAVKLASLLSML